MRNFLIFVVSFLAFWFLQLVHGCTLYAEAQENTLEVQGTGVYMVVQDGSKCDIPGVTYYEDTDGNIVVCPAPFQDLHEDVILPDVQCYLEYDFVFININTLQEDMNALNTRIKKGWTVQGSIQWMYTGNVVLGIATTRKEVCTMCNRTDYSMLLPGVVEIVNDMYPHFRMNRESLMEAIETRNRNRSEYLTEHAYQCDLKIFQDALEYLDAHEEDAE